jgi:hypothetical protein
MRETLESRDLVLWLRLTAEAPVADEVGTTSDGPAPSVVDE